MKIKRNKKDRRIKYSYFSIWRFILYFLFTAFMVTSSFLIFFNDGTHFEENIIIFDETISTRAIITANNLLLLCLFFSICDSVRRRALIKKPVEKILDATHKVKKGDFSVRIPYVNLKPFHNEFDIIIEDFNTMIEELATIETLKTDFISNVSHEIKTPLSAIQNYATLLQDPSLSEEERTHYAKHLFDVSKRMGSLITNILKLNKLENQQIILSKKSYNLTEQLCGCMLVFEDEWERKELVIETDLQDDVIIECDSELLEIVWNNILSNAVKFNKVGGTVSLKLYTQSGKAVVIISDTGCGIDSETSKHIFDKFYQGDSSRSTQGNGLGLALVKRIAHMINADVTVSSEPGIGTSFTVKIPIAQ